MALYPLFPIMIATAIVLLFKFINSKYNPPIFGVYRQRNKYFWFKFLFMYMVLRLKQLYVHLKYLLAVELGYSYDGTVHIHENDVALEQKYNLGDYPQSVDAVYFNGTSKTGDALIVGVALRPEFYVDAFMFLKVNNDVLMTPDLPDTRLKQTALEVREYMINGISLANVIPMRTWKVAYNGEMKSRNENGKKLNVIMDLTWSAKWPHFNYDTDMSPMCMAKDMAREYWSADYFKMLQRVHQTHYEQMGVLTGTVLVDGKKILIDMPCVRDHSFGKWREWRNFHRYILQFVYLENGDSIAIGLVSQPSVLSHLTIGYYCRKSDQAVMAIKNCDLKMWQHGENYTMPKDYGFSFMAGGERYDVKVEVNDEEYFYIGNGREAKINERWAKMEVNGINGWGCLEWQYNNVVQMNS